MTALSLAAGCSGGDDNPVVEAPTSTSMPTAITGSRSPAPTSPTTAEATVDPTVVPDEITVEYLDAVMAEHDRLVAQVYRHLAASGDPTDPTVLERYAAFANVADAKRDVEGAIRGFGVDGIADDPQPPHAEVEQIIDQRDGCVLFTLSYDSTPLLADDVDYEPAETYYVALRPAEVSDLNPVPWKQSQIPTFYGDGQTPPSNCADLEGTG